MIKKNKKKNLKKSERWLIEVKANREYKKLIFTNIIVRLLFVITAIILGICCLFNINNFLDIHLLAFLLCLASCSLYILSINSFCSQNTPVMAFRGKVVKVQRKSLKGITYSGVCDSELNCKTYLVKLENDYLTREGIYYLSSKKNVEDAIPLGCYAYWYRTHSGRKVVIR